MTITYNKPRRRGASRIVDVRANGVLWRLEKWDGCVWFAVKLERGYGRGDTIVPEEPISDLRRAKKWLEEIIKRGINKSSKEAV